MAKRTCSIEGCDSPHQARGYCMQHYQKWRRFDKEHDTCGIDECDAPARSRGYCDKHYLRILRHGDPHHAGKPKAPPKVCIVEGCNNNRHVTIGYCNKHYQRYRRRGNVEIVLAIPNGESHPKWTATPTYMAMHLRVRAVRGPAYYEQCIDCNQGAREWSYNHTDGDHITDEAGRRYSADVMKYDPRCVPCHRRFDQERRTT